MCSAGFSFDGIKMLFAGDAGASGKESGYSSGPTLFSRLSRVRWSKFSTRLNGHFALTPLAIVL
jgi:hypothetical protein